MTVSPEGSLSLCLQYLINTVSASARFQTVVGADNATEAKAKIFRSFAVDTDDDNTNPQAPPRAIVRHLSGDMTELIGTTQWSSHGPLRLLFNFPNDPELTQEENDITFTNNVGIILDEMKTLATTDPGAGPYLSISGLQGLAIGQNDEQEAPQMKDHWIAEYIVHWKGQ